MNRIFLHLHLILSLFFAPLIGACAITGMLNIFHVSEQWTSSVSVFEYPNEGKEGVSKICDDLVSRGVEIPADPIRPFKGNLIKGKPSSLHVLFKDQGDRVSVEVVQPGPYPKLLLMHKGKVGTLANFGIVGAGIAIMLAYISGIGILWSNPKRRRAMALWFGAGILFFVIAYLSTF